jgi:hypothetical protein
MNGVSATASGPLPLLPPAGSMRGRLCAPEDMRRFIEAGNATITICSRGSGQRFTYRFRRAEEGGDARPWFVSLLSGPDNEGSYSYMGIIRPGAMGGVQFTRKSKVGAGAPSAKGLDWFLHHLYAGNAANLRQAEVWHEGRCGRCGRKLTVPESVATGFGPDCAQQVGL